tara:strand:- start:5394 stop:6137 length:744 start_codon:yes stop_codon:yes gene_type:complete
MNNNKEIKIYGVRPLLEAINSGKSINKVIFKRNNSLNPNQKKIINILKENSIPFSFAPSEKFNKLHNKNHQGIIALISPIDIITIEQLISQTKDNKNHRIYVLLDGITDTRNFGAIIRTCAAFNINGIIISEDNSAPVNSDVIKTSAGGAFKVKIARVKNLKDAVYHLKTNDISIIGLSEKGEKIIYDYNLKKSIAIVLGSEDRGISKGITNLCDETINIPIQNIDSLNVSVAFSVIAYEAYKQRIF